MGPRNAPALWLYRANATAPSHVAFRAPSRKAVDLFHAAGLAARGRDHGRPGLRVDDGAGYCAALLLDPDDHNVEAVCTGDR